MLQHVHQKKLNIHCVKATICTQYKSSIIYQTQAQMYHHFLESCLMAEKKTSHLAT